MNDFEHSTKSLCEKHTLSKEQHHKNHVIKTIDCEEFFDHVVAITRTEFLDHTMVYIDSILNTDVFKYSACDYYVNCLHIQT